MKLSHSYILSFATVCVFALMPDASADAGKAYQLKLKREMPKGYQEHNHFKIKQTTTQKIVVGGKVAQEQTEELETEAVGIIEIQEVSPHQKPTKVKFTVEKFLLKNGEEGGSVPMKPGAIVIAKLGDDPKPTFTVNGTAAEPDVSKALGLIFEMSPDREEETDEDAVFSTDKPRTVGSEWEGDVPKLLASMPPDMPFELSEKEAKVTMKLLSVKTEAGQECFEVRQEATLKPSKLNGLPGEVKVVKSSLKITEDKLMPTDPKGHALRDHQKMTFDFTAKIDTPDGQAATIEVSGNVSRQSESKAVK